MTNIKIDLENIKNNKLVQEYLEKKNLLNADIKAYKGIVYEAGSPDLNETLLFDVVYTTENNEIKRQKIKFTNNTDSSKNIHDFYNQLKHRNYYLVPVNCLRGLPVVLVEITNDSGDNDYIIVERDNLFAIISQRAQIEVQEELEEFEYAVVNEIAYYRNGSIEDAYSLDYYVDFIAKVKDKDEWQHIYVNCRKADIANLIEYTTNSSVWDEYEEGDEETFHIADLGDRFEKINLKAIFGTEYPIEFLDIEDSNFKWFRLLEAEKETGKTIRRYEFDEFDGRGW